MSSEAKKIEGVLQSAGVVPAVAGIDAVAIYDPKDGRVVHMHHAITFEGAEMRRDRETQCRRALESVRQLGLELEGLEVLHVPDFEPSDKIYRVDLKTGSLVGVRAVRPDVDQEDEE